MDVALTCAVPFYSAERTSQQTGQIVVTDILESLWRDRTSKTKSAPRRRPSRACRRRKAVQEQEQEQEQELSITSSQTEDWRQLGTTLRHIADKFGGTQRETGHQRLTSTDGVMSAILTFVLWKIVKKTFL